jgi:hypothetical protein
VESEDNSEGEEERMRCPDCNKFVSFDEQEPEINSIEVDDSGNVSAEVRIVNACGDCGAELKEANFSPESGDPVEPFAKHKEDATRTHEQRLADYGVALEEWKTKTGFPPTEALEPEKPLSTEHELEVEEDGSERTSRSVGKGRGTKTYYGFSLGYTVTCSCGDFSVSGVMEDDEQASGMDELV